MRIGTGRTDITPPKGTLMGGQLEDVRSCGTESPLYATALALSDDNLEVLWVACDLLMFTNEMAREVRCLISQQTGVLAEAVIVSATHTHSGPLTVPVFGMASDAAYCSRLPRLIADAAVQAHRDLNDGSLRVGSGRLGGWSFNRRFLMSDGTVQTHPLKGDPHMVAPEGPDTDDLRLLLGTDTEGKPVTAALNYACHATTMDRGNRLVSSDYPGSAAAELERHLGRDSRVLFWNGPCGNLCQVNPRDTNRHEVGKAHKDAMGKAIAQAATETMRGLAETRGALRLARTSLQLERRAIPEELLHWAMAHQRLVTSVPRLSDYGTEPYPSVAPTVSLEELFATPFWANFYANEIRTLHSEREANPYLTMDLTVVHQDNWALVALPCELFVEWGDALRKESPFEHTFLVELANGWVGYIPTELAFARPGGYETKEVTSTKLVPQAGQQVLDAVMELLQGSRP